MKNDLKEYTDILIILNEDSKPQAKYNKLLKIWANTEDLKLKDLLYITLNGYRNYIPPRANRIGGGYPANFKQWLEYMKPIRKDLTEYVEDILSMQKPQWQILAERNGWVRPL